jgi:UDPglucose--hexose-1-phosphate uridylyltransferase
MPELRRDELTGLWALIAPARAARPYTFPSPSAASAEPPADCPFCPGHEAMTPPEVYRTGEGMRDTKGWRIRVFPNLYPMVGGENPGPGASGAHEVMVLSPEHKRSFAQLAEEDAVAAVTVLRDRARRHLASGHSYVGAFINHGSAAGASIEHPHGQVVALDVVPPVVEAALARVDAAGTDLVAAAVAAAPHDRLVVVDGPAPAWCPAASSAPFEIRVAHRSTGARFDEATDAEVAAVALAARDALARLAAVLGDAPYSLVVHTAPQGRVGSFHWYVEIRPRISIAAGFEQATGIYVNIVPPERAASQLREAPLA